MKKLILLLLLCATGFAADRVTVTLTITNNPSAAQTFTVNAATRTWRASVTAPSTEVLIGADIGASATNLFRQLASYPLSGPVTLGFSSSNVITIQGRTGQAMAASISAAYGVVTLSTNAGSDLPIVRVPFSSEAAYPQTNNPTQLAIGMGTYSQAAFETNTTLVSKLVQIDGDQEIAGGKDFLSPVTLRDALFVSNNLPRIIFFDDDGGADAKFATITSDENGMTFLFEDDTYADPQAAFFISRNGLTPESVTFISPLVATTLQGTLIDSGITNATTTNTTFTGANTVTGTWANTRANHTSLANGNNAGVTFTGKVYNKLKAGPTAAFTINGIAGGTDGRMLIIDNSIAQNMTIANDSGVEPTAANRIYTRTGSDVSTTGQGVVTLIYDSEDSRWILVSVRD